MNKTEKLLLLMDLQKQLAYLNYDKLGLINLDRLRGEVIVKIREIKNK